MTESLDTPGTRAGTALAATISFEDLTKLKVAFPLAVETGGSEEDLALSAGVPITVARAALDDPATAAQLMSAHRHAERNGKLLKPLAAALTAAWLRKLTAAEAAGELDADDINNLLPKVHKVVEHADRMEAARGDPNDGLTVFHIHIGRHISAHIVPVGEVVESELLQEVRADLRALDDVTDLDTVGGAQ